MTVRLSTVIRPCFLSSIRVRIVPTVGWRMANLTSFEVISAVSKNLSGDWDKSEPLNIKKMSKKDRKDFFRVIIFESPFFFKNFYSA